MLHIPNKSALERKIDIFQSAGSSGFHVVSDWDQTMTHAFIDGQRANNSFSALMSGDWFDPCRDQAEELYDFYYPKENDKNLSLEERSQLMLEWWEKHVGLVVEAGLDINTLKDIMDQNETYLRDGAGDFFHMLSDNDVPLLVFSAGVGEMITSKLENDGFMTHNVHVVSNFYRFDDSGNFCGYEGKIIHPFNKSEVAVKDLPYHAELEGRRNVLLLGDHVADANMANGMEHDCVLKIGYLNDPANQCIDEYSTRFDVIVLGDGNMSYVNGLIKDIL